MRDSVSEFFLLELEGWNESLVFYKEETGRASEWLKSIIQLNTVPGLAVKVEDYLSQYSHSSAEIDGLMQKIRTMNTQLNEDDLQEKSEAERDTVISSQRELRTGMQELEKKYLALKYECDEFVASTLALQQHRP